MFNRSLAQRLVRRGLGVFIISFIVFLSGVGIAYGPFEAAGIAVLVAGHMLIVLGVIGIKVGYFMRLAAQDVLDPHPDGWLREGPSPDALPRAGVKKIMPPSGDRRSA